MTEIRKVNTVGQTSTDVPVETVESTPEGRIRQFLEAYNSRWMPKMPIIYSLDGHDLTTADLLEVLDELAELRRG